MTRITVEIPEESKAEILTYLESKGVYFEENEKPIDVAQLLTADQISSLEETKKLISEGKMEFYDWDDIKGDLLNVD
jgi:hypothetical protein